MSYWFDQPHTLVLARARMEFTQSRKRDRLCEKSETASGERGMALHAFGRKN
jgi:hypothetical protein